MNATGRPYRFAAAALPHRLEFGFSEPAETLEDVSVQQNPNQDVVTFFGFSGRPFPAGLEIDRASSVGPLGENLQSLIQALRDDTAVAIVTGPSGTGKSTLCHRITHSDEVPLEPVLLGSGKFDDPVAILQTVLFELDEPYEGLGLQELRLRLLKRARQLRPDRNGLLVIIDEAELLAPEVLEELRSWTTHTHEGSPLVRLVLCGSIEFDERLASHELQGLNQRIGCLITTEVLTFEQAIQFVTGQFESVGVSPEVVLEEEAFELICRASDGNLKGICVLADQVLRDAASVGEKPVSAETVVAALRGLRNLPVHWNLPAQLELSAGNTETADDDVQQQDSVATPVEVPGWNESEDEVAVLEFGPDDGSSAAVPNDPQDQTDEQQVMESTSTPGVIEFSVDDPYAALDQQHGTWCGVVPLVPVMSASANPDAGAQRSNDSEAVESQEDSAGSFASGAVHATPEAGYDAESEQGCDAEQESRIQADLESLSQQIHEALRNTGRLRTNPDLFATGWYGNDVEYDVIQPDDGSGDVDCEKLETAQSALPAELESEFHGESEPEPDLPGGDIVPLAELESSGTSADVNEDRPCGEPASTEAEGERYSDGDAEETDLPRSRYALLFSRLKRRRADVVRRFTDA